LIQEIYFFFSDIEFFYVGGEFIKLALFVIGEFALWLEECLLFVFSNLPQPLFIPSRGTKVKRGACSI
jgi:hypothetical protein